MKWTKEQQSAIDARGENILLSAAAGSGKTAVLVERIIKLITDENNSVDVNRLLVLTFTKAAAAEMKNKISVAIEKKLKENPRDENLKRQRLLLSSANISTVHSFCLEMLKANIHLTDIPVDFAQCTESDGAIILSKCIDDVLAQYYEKIDKLKSFKDIVDGYSTGKTDVALREILDGLYKFVVSMPYPVKWLNDTAAEYKKVCLTQNIYDTVWDRELKKILRQSCKRLEELMDAELSFCEEYLDDMEGGTPHKYTTFFTVENGSIQNLLERVKHQLELEEDGKYDKISEMLNGFKLDKLVTVRANGDPEHKALLERAKVYRNEIRDEIKKLCGVLTMSENTMVERLCVNYPRVRTLKNLVIRIMRRFKREKRKKNLLDFNDMEHEMFNLISDKNGNLKEAAYILKERYVEILVDEYQDTNYIQDAIFRAISRDNKNVFMVGDIKQSIYMFRNAVPQLFLDKYESYTVKDGENITQGDGRLICLNKNFRSRTEVIDTANFIFENLMSRELGGVEYNEGEKLIAGAEYPEAIPNTVDSELIFIHNDTDKDKTSDEKNSVYEVEARTVALKIKELVESGYVTDKQTKKIRRAEYRDIVILVRNANKLAPIYESAFAATGIPLQTGMGRSYLSSIEVQTVISFLQIIDNPYQDIPLIAVMRSPIFAFTANELAGVRSYKKNGYFYDALLEYAKDNNSDKCEKVRHFLGELAMLRAKFEFADIHSIIWHIYYNYNYFSLVGVMDDSALRQDNLRLLYNIALDFENNHFEGLFGFMNYIEGLIENGKDLAVSNELGENSNVVTLMSIHKSKGLEFPIVILGGATSGFNFCDTSKKIIWSKELGISMDCYDSEINAIYPSVTKKLASIAMKADTISEEMRLLYVALTRAKEKLILVASSGSRNKGWMKALFGRDGKPLAAYRTGVLTMQDWILSALLRHRDMDILRDYSGVVEGITDNKTDFSIKVYEVEESSVMSGVLGVCEEDETEYDNIADIAEDEILTSQMRTVRQEIKENLFKAYKYKRLGEISTKVSVTELKRMKNEQFPDESGAEIAESDVNLFDENSDNIVDVKFRANHPKRSISDGLVEVDDRTFRSATEISNADIGTIVHFVMQHIDFNEAKTAEGVENQLDKMVECGMLSDEQRRYVQSGIIVDFANSEICERMLKANMLKKEFGFYISLDAKEIYNLEDGDVLDGETVLMQGIIDCFFEEDDGLVIVDYKTDRISEKFAESYSERYRAQVEYYQSAVEKIFNKKVKQKYLYYLGLGKSVEIR